MQKPVGYDQSEAKQFGLNQKPPAGAYVMKIVTAAETMSSTNRPMIVLCLDIAQGEHTGNFNKLWEYFKKSNPEAKWPCVHRRCTDAGQLEYFKGDIKAIEESNPGFTFNFDEKTLKGKLVGCMLREKATGEDKDGNIKTVLEPAFLCSKEKALSGSLKPMPIKFENGSNQQSNNSDPELPEDMPF